MRWRGKKQSSNIEDIRGQGSRRRPIGRVGGSKGLGIGTIIIAGIVWYMGGNPMDVLMQSAGSGSPLTEQYSEPHQSTEQEEMLADIVGVVLKETEDVWVREFPKQLGKSYRAPKLVLFEQQVNTACGRANSATGPFYCPGDMKVYIDVEFYEMLSKRFGASGDFAFAYVVAHEVGHHIQKLLGFTDYVHGQKGRISEVEYNQLSVKLELQADFLAGAWAHHSSKTTDLIEQGDISEAITAAEAIGDDNIQKQTQGYVQPERFTHGTSEQRKRWFKEGLDSGQLSEGDTFSAKKL